ncbi:MAG: magnesium transporter CorA family protein [Acidimicrobiales bacterium]
MHDHHTRAYRCGALVAEGFPLDDVGVQLDRPDVMVWVDLNSPSKEDLRRLAEELGLHELAVEDALEPHQRPKLDRYESHLFLSCHAVTVEPAEGRLRHAEIDAFIGERWFITVHNSDAAAVDALVRRLDRSTHLLGEGVGYLLYALLDVVVDGYFDAVGAFDDYYDEVSERIFSERPLEPAKQQRWFEMRRALVQLHRLIGGLREALSALMRREHGAVSDALYPYYQDVYDHVLRIGESTDALRDLVGTIVETNLSLREYRQNQVMKKVTSWAAIIAVPTLVTGWYGMNVPFPGSGRPWGVASAAALVGVLSVGLFVLFRRRDWL